jgi:hypothetical protein
MAGDHPLHGQSLQTFMQTLFDFVEAAHVFREFGIGSGS